MRLLLTIALPLLVFTGWGQDTLYLSDLKYNQSIADHFELSLSKVDFPIGEFTGRKKELEQRKLRHSVENLDFTSSSFFIDLVLVNDLNEDRNLFIETGRPITNTVELLEVGSGKIVRSGDAIPFSSKGVQSNRSILPVALKSGDTQRFILKLGSDGEIISLPVIIWKEKAFHSDEVRKQFMNGLFYGIFLFVIVIYLTFYVQLRDRLFLNYAIYVLFSGLLQFSLDGYSHQFIFKSGNYLTQHMVIVVAGLTVFIFLNYANNYLKLVGRYRKITSIFSWVVMTTIVASLVPGKLYEICYPLINGFSLISILYLLFVTLRQRRLNTEISPLFLFGIIVLIVGAIVFILGNFSLIDWPALTLNALKIGTLIEIITLSILMAGKYRQLQREKEKAQKLLLVELEEKNLFMSEANLRLETEVKQRTLQIEEQRRLLKEKNEDFLASIKYAERIQSAVLSNEMKFKEVFPDSFIFFRPKDIVSGDFYWVEEIAPTENWPNGLIIFATADCTGHGVPGAFVSIVCNNLLKIGKSHPDVQNPGQALDFVNREINEVLNSKYNNQIRDGMDISLCAIDPKTKILHFAGAKNGVMIVRNGEIIHLQADKRPIGYSDEKEEFHYANQEMQLLDGDVIYSYSDGYMDQFGGMDNKKFLSRRFRELITRIYLLGHDEQRGEVQKAFEDWLNGGEQIDDVLIIGVRV